MTLKGKHEAVKQMQNELVTLNRKQTNLHQLLKNPAYSHVILKLINIMNGQTWLRQLSLKNQRDSSDMVHVFLDGFSFRNEDLGDFIAGLSSERANEPLR